MSIQSITAAIQRRGQTLLLRRLTGSGPNQSFFDVELKGMVRSYHPSELIGGIIQGDREVILSNKEIGDRQWPGPPKRDDRIQIAGKFTNVQAVDTVYIGDDIVQHIVQVRG